MTQPLQLNNVSITYGDHTVVSGVSLSLGEGEIGCLLGPSGCGKTSLLRAIAGFERPSAGSVTIADHIVAGGGQWVMPEARRVGMVFQDFALFPHLTVAANIGFGLAHWASDEAKARIKQLLRLVGLSEYEKSYPHQLSGGQQQRVALARALAPKPDLLLLDEPFSSIDTELREQLAIEIRAVLKAENTAAILVTHDQQEAFTIADRIGVIRDGLLRQWDAARALYQQPADPVVAEFIGGGMLIQGELSASQTARTALGEIPVSLLNVDDGLAPGTKLKVLIRPQQLRVIPADDTSAKVTVNSVVFRGAVSHYHIQLPGQDEVIICESPSLSKQEFDSLAELSAEFIDDLALAYPCN